MTTQTMPENGHADSRDTDPLVSVNGTAGGSKTPASPTNSVSSILSSESTRKLIRGLSQNALNAQGLEPESSIVISPVLPSIPATPVTESAPKPESKKPVKFTVRKVSREESAVPQVLPKERRKHKVYGNIPDGGDAKAMERGAQLQQNQEKYDQYMARIDKIDKEIRFLTNLLPPYNVEIDYSTRTKITRAIEKLTMKKDEIEKKKYSLGISISRLWREYDDSNTWVRSVSKQ